MSLHAIRLIKKYGIIYDGVSTNFSLLERKEDADDI